MTVIDKAEIFNYWGYLTSMQHRAYTSGAPVLSASHPAYDSVINALQAQDAHEASQPTNQPEDNLANNNRPKPSW